MVLKRAIDPLQRKPGRAAHGLGRYGDVLRFSRGPARHVQHSRGGRRQHRLLPSNDPVDVGAQPFVVADWDLATVFGFGTDPGEAMVLSECRASIALHHAAKEVFLYGVRAFRRTIEFLGQAVPLQPDECLDQPSH